MSLSYIVFPESSTIVRKRVITKASIFHLREISSNVVLRGALTINQSSVGTLNRARLGTAAAPTGLGDDW